MQRDLGICTAIQWNIYTSRLNQTFQGKKSYFFPLSFLFYFDDKKHFMFLQQYKALLLLKLRSSYSAFTERKKIFEYYCNTSSHMYSVWNLNNLKIDQKLIYWFIMQIGCFVPNLSRIDKCSKFWGMTKCQTLYKLIRVMQFFSHFWYAIQVLRFERK